MTTIEARVTIKSSLEQSLQAAKVQFEEAERLGFDGRVLEIYEQEIERLTKVIAAIKMGVIEIK